MDAYVGDTETSKRLHQKTREVIETLDYSQYRERRERKHKKGGASKHKEKTASTIVIFETF